MAQPSTKMKPRFRAFRPALIALILAFLVVLTTGCLGYLARAGCGQAQILLGREPINEVIADPETPEEVRRKLEHVERVRTFANEHLGLRAGETYTTYTFTGRDAAAYNVTASEPLRLEAHTWWFPVVGSVPYLGYFSREEAQEKADALSREGFDVLVSDVPAYSTLGWFDDPLLSSQMSYSDVYLTHLVIHESAHRTLWFPGDVSFNESFASFVEREGALQFYRENGQDEVAGRLIELRAEQARLNVLFREYALQLETLYQSGRERQALLEGKTAIIEQFRSELLRQAPTFRILRLEEMAGTDFNNAHFLQYLRYSGGSGFFARQFAGCAGSWPCFFDRMTKLVDLSPEDRRALLEANPLTEP